jgi:methionyl-tRNA formyltransferase
MTPFSAERPVAARPSTVRPSTVRPSAARVVFLGTPQFAIPTLRACAAATDVVAVVTQPDRPAGRGRKMNAPPVAVVARDLGLTVLQPASLKAEAARQAIASLRPDVIVCVAYGRIIPRAVLATPTLGAINLHPSLLPAYRGASPIQTAILDGLDATGITVMHLADELDAGDIIAQREIAIGPEETAGELEVRMAEIGAQMVLDVIESLVRGDAPRRPQAHARATYVGKVDKADGAVDWNRPARAVVNHIRAMNPWPCAFTTWRGGTLKVWRARIGEGRGIPGMVLAVDGHGITVATGGGAVLLVEVQQEGGRRLPAAEFARGHRLGAGARFGGPRAAPDTS